MSENQLLYQTEENSKGERVVISKTEYRNVEYIDVRKHFKSEEEYYPTKQGARFSTEALLEVVKALVEVLEADERVELYEELESKLAEDVDKMGEETKMHLLDKLTDNV